MYGCTNYISYQYPGHFYPQTVLNKNITEQKQTFLVSHFLLIKTVLTLQEFCLPECKPMSMDKPWQNRTVQMSPNSTSNHYGAISASWCILVITCTLRPSPWVFPHSSFPYFTCFCWPGNGHLPWMPSPTWADLHNLPFKIDTGLWSSIIHPCPIRVTNPWRRQ